MTVTGGEHAELEPAGAPGVRGGTGDTGDGGKTDDVEIVASGPRAAERSPSDVLRLAVAAAVVLALFILERIGGSSLARYVADLLRGLDVLPEAWLQVVFGLVRLSAVVLLIAGLVVAGRAGRWRLVVTVAIAAATAGVLTALTNEIAPDAAGTVLDQDLIARDLPAAWGVAAASAAITASAPWLSRSWRRIGWSVVVGLAIVRFLSQPISFDTLRAFLLGWLTGAVVVVLLGGPDRRPTGRSIATGLARVGVPLTRLEQASLDARGSTPYFGTGADGRRLFVKALGADQRSADLLFRLYRGLVPRHLGDERPFSSLRRAVEHEALVALAALGYDIRTPRVVALTTAEPNGFVLAYEAVEGRSLDRLEPDEVTDRLLQSIWENVAELRTHRIAHRDLRLANIFVAADGEVWMIDFGFSELAASDLLLANDVAELLASSSLQVGPGRAVAAAASVVGSSVLAASSDRLQPWALSGATRSGLKQNPGLLDDLRARVAAAAGAAG